MILLTGATGYVGSHLLERLERDGLGVRAISRDPARLAGRTAPTTEAVRADLDDAASLAAALEGVDAAYYLVHSLGAADGFAERDRRAASNFAEAAEAAGVARIVYLGGLGRSDDELSPHLASRHEVGKILRESRVPTVELRASVVIGEGSASYDLLSFVVENVPAAVVPDWVRTPSQPIAVDDVVEYLAAALDVPLDGSRIYEIGGPEQLSYLDLMRAYADERGLRRTILPLPIPEAFEPAVDLWQRALESAAPERVKVWLRLIESLRNETTVHDDAAARDFPDVHPRPVADAFAAAGAAVDD